MKRTIIYKEARFAGMKPGFSLFIQCALVLAFGAALYFASGLGLGASLALTALTPALKEDGLAGDELKMVQNLNKRFAKIDINNLEKEDVELIVRKAMEKFEALDVAKLKEFLGEDDKGIRAILLKQGEELVKLKEGRKEPEDLSVRGQVTSWLKLNEEAVKKIRNGQKADLEPLQLRVANVPMTPANTYDAGVTLQAGALIRDGAPLIDLLRIQPTLWDKKVVAGSGAADFLAPAGSKPKVSFTLTTEKSNAKKVAVSMKVSTEMLDDVDGMTSLIEGELAYQLKYEINRVLMSANAATSTDIAGIRSFATAYTLTGVQTTNPNNYDAIQAGIAQLRLAFVTGPILVAMNPVDVVNMKITKAISQGQYMGLNLLPIPGGFIVEDPNIVQGDVMMIALDYLKILIYKDFKITYGWENTDFTDNLVTAIAETRFHEFHSDNHAAGFLYEQLSDIKTAIAIV